MGNKNWNRREWLKTASSVAVGVTIARPILGSVKKETPFLDYKNENYKRPNEPICCVVLGAGNRGNVYASYAKKHPEEMKIVGVAEPIKHRREKFAKTYNIEKKYQYVTWEDALKIPQYADALIISTPDNLHYGPAMQGMELGYDLLLEKPVAQTWQQNQEILLQSKKYKSIVAVAHVLRYTTYFREIKRILDSNELGEIVSIQHMEPVYNVHMSHSYVRGIWRKAEDTNPMILAKSCHDTDMIRWLVGKSCKRVSSFGSLKYFKEENAPEGSTLRCTDGCKVEKECPYSAIKIYLKKQHFTPLLFLPDNKDETILNALKTGPYGRCVFHCDNDVVDHQVMSMEFEDGITATFNMEGHTSFDGRRTRIFGTKGDIVGDQNSLTFTKFLTGKQYNWDLSMGQKIESGHGGGDFGLTHDFIQAVSQKDETLLTSTLDLSMESHLMGFKAEESRINNGEVKEINLFE